MASLEVEQHAEEIGKALRALQGAIQNTRDASLTAYVYF